MKWPFAIAGLLALATMIWFPEWTIATALALACFMEIFPRWLGFKERRSFSADWSIFVIGLALLGIAIVDWLLRYQGDVPFSNLLFPNKDAPYDLRIVFLGWLFMFQALIGKLRRLISGNEQPEA